MAVITTGVAEVTAAVCTLNVVFLDPAGTRILPGMDTALLLLVLKSTIVPPAGALPFNVTVQTVGEPPITGFGLKESDETSLSPFGVIVTVAVFITLL